VTRRAACVEDLLDGGEALGLNLGAPVRLRLGGGALGTGLVRREDWDSLSDWGQLVHALKLGSDTGPGGAVGGGPWRATASSPGTWCAATPTGPTRTTTRRAPPSRAPSAPSTWRPSPRTCWARASWAPRPRWTCSTSSLAHRGSEAATPWGCQRCMTGVGRTGGLGLLRGGAFGGAPLPCGSCRCVASLLHDCVGEAPQPGAINR
jgi:hypothetical protein